MHTCALLHPVRAPSALIDDEVVDDVENTKVDKSEAVNPLEPVKPVIILFSAAILASLMLAEVVKYLFNILKNIKVYFKTVKI